MIDTILNRVDSVYFPDTVYHGVNINCPDAPYHSGLIDTVMDELYPITMPYMPADRAFKIYMKPQSKEVTPSKEAQTIMPDEEYNCLSQVTVKAIPYVETDNSAGGKTVTIG